MYKTKDIVKQIKSEIGDDINYNSVQNYIAKSGWSIVLYGDDKHKSADDMLLKIGKTSYAYGVDSFSYEDGSRKIIFINVKHKTNTLFLLLHECGHIKAGHIKKDGIYGCNDKAAERQANRIARNILRDSKFLGAVRKNPIKTAVIGGICCTIVLCTLLVAAPAIYNNLLFPTQETQTNPYSSSAPISTTIPTEPPEQVQESIPQGQTVWVTRTGEVYHTKPDCSYIRGKTDLREMDISVAIESGLRICSQCNN